MTKTERRKLEAKKLLKFYRRNKLAVPSDVDAVQVALKKAVAKRGHKTYRKDRPRCDRFIKRLFKKYQIKGTSSEEFWRVTCVCMLIGPTKAYLNGLRKEGTNVKESNANARRMSKAPQKNSRRKR
jgi:hypothetical protein